VRSLHGAPLLVALLVGLGLLPAAVRADTAPPASPPPAAQPAPPRSLVVALTLGNARLQAGVVRGRDVILARGFEVELARILARRLGARVGGFVYVPTAPRLLASSLAGWQLALGGIEPAGGSGTAGEATRSYLTTDLAVVGRPGLHAPRRLADLRGAILCAIRGSGAAAVAAQTHSRKAPLLVRGPERLRAVLRTGVCDAALVPALEAGRFVEGQRRLLGPIAGRIEHGDGYVVLLRRGEGLDLAAVDRALERLARDGTLARLARTWLDLDPAALPILR
jgi:ABC-type amino acid transport substrate-binding protein